MHRSVTKLLTKYLFASTVFVGLAGLCGPATLHAAGCGNIIYPADYYYVGSEEEITPIENCQNPFNADDTVNFTASLTINNQAVEAGAVISVSADEVATIEYMMDPPSFNMPVNIFKHIDADYLLVYPTLGSEPQLTAGTYTAVFVYEEPPILSKRQESWWSKLLSRFVPTTYAFYPSYAEVRTVQFTIMESMPAPKQNSVLFLPGIMGSHLYENDNACFGFGEQRRWFSHTDCEQERLFLDENGNSLYDIYTKDEDGAVAAGVYAAGVYRLASMYEDYMDAMNDLVGTDIASFKAFPYDWRLRLDQQLQTTKNTAGEVRYDSSIEYQDGLLYKTIESLPNSVTIVTHSNGGLVAKALMAKLQAENDPLLAKIKNLVLVGVPQVGTPEAVVGVLHGSPISGGTVVTQETSRALLNNAPFGYHLLPNESYFDGDGSAVETPVIVFDKGTTTDAWRATYGEAIDSYAEMRTFMGSASGRSVAAIDDLYTPQIANDTLLDYGESIADVLSTWTPSTTTRVYQLAGTGMWTPKTLRYFTGEKCTSYMPVTGACLAYGPQLLHETYFTQAGDGTVVLPSAAALRERENVERWWLDLDKYAKQVADTLVHRDMLEHPEVSTFIRDIMVGSSTTGYSYISRTMPTLPTEHQLVYRLHSPLDMYVTSSVGVVSSTTNTIRGTTYRRLGETQYVILPADIPDAVLHLAGQSSGSFTLVAEDWQGEERTVLHDYQAIPTATSTIVTLDLLATTTLSIDFDGDGTFEGIVAAERDMIDVASVTSTTTSLPAIAETQGSRPKSKPVPVPQVAGASTDADLIRIEQMVQLLQQIINLYIQLKKVS